MKKMRKAAIRTQAKSIALATSRTSSLRQSMRQAVAFGAHVALQLVSCEMTPLDVVEPWVDVEPPAIVVVWLGRKHLARTRSARITRLGREQNGRGRFLPVALLSLVDDVDEGSAFVTPHRRE